MEQQLLSWVVAGGLILFGGSIASVSADPVADFYESKTITMVVPFAPGGISAQFAQVVAERMGQYVPGKPNIVLEVMPGAAGVIAQNYAYNSAPRDGSVIIIPNDAIGLAQYLDPEGVEYKTLEFQWIGVAAQSTNVLMVRKDTGVESVEDLKTTEVHIGSSGPGSGTDMFPRLTNAILGTKMNVIPGYPGGASEVLVAIESGELDGSANGNTTWEARPDLVAILNPLIAYGSGRAPNFPDVPNLVELVDNPADKQVIRFLSSANPLARSLAALPDTPADRVAALRRAFDQMMEDPDFIADMKTLKQTLQPMTGEEAQAMIVEALDVPEEVIERARQLIAAE
jgi:tripartite-type tricarboxylate transporter receptor subunit TctC